MKFRAIGIAGYMGAGKSSAARILAQTTGARIVDADSEAKRLMQSDQRLIGRIAEEFGAQTLVDGQISFPTLGTIVFRNTDNLRRLNRLVHPPLIDRLHEIDGTMKGESYILDAALIPLWGIESWFDAVIWVEAAISVRLERLRSSTGLSDACLRNRMSTQERILAVPGEPPWRSLANNGTTEALSESLASIL